MAPEARPPAGIPRRRPGFLAAGRGSSPPVGILAAGRDFSPRAGFFASGGRAGSGATPNPPAAPRGPLPAGGPAELSAEPVAASRRRGDAGGRG